MINCVIQGCEMTLKKEKYSDGLFSWEQTTIPMDNWNPENEQALDDFFDNVRNIESQLNKVETRIHKLQEISQKKTERHSPKLQKHNDKYKELNQVESYADKALSHLKQARENLLKRDIEQAMIDTIYMMDAYWYGFTHTDCIKTPIILDAVQTPPKKKGGNIRGNQKKEEAKVVHELVMKIYKTSRTKKYTEIQRILKNKHGIERSSHQIGNIVKKEQAQNA